MRFTVSNIILFIVFIVLLLATLNTYIVIQNLKSLKAIDGYFINKMGQIRGSIQRYSKLKIVNDNIYLQVEKQINQFFNDIDKNKEKFFQNKYLLENFDTDFYLLKNIWKSIEKSNDKDLIIKNSEKAWKLADKMNLFNKNVSEKKNKKLIKEFIILNLMSVIFLLIISIITYFYVTQVLEKEKITDPLTKLYNRRYFYFILDKLMQEYFLHKTPFTFIFLDIDNFKKINDNFGHNEGDKVLKEISKLILSLIRKDDYVFRYGGEEIVILLKNTSIQEGIYIANRIRKAIETNIKVGNKSVTVSIGVKEYKGEDKNEFIKEVDALMYKAKKAGKNRVEYEN